MKLHLKNGICRIPTCKITLEFEGGAKVTVEAARYTHPGGDDVLIGMDIISRGDFHILNNDGDSEFSLSISR